MDDLVEGLFPAGRIHLIGGAAGAGKTTLLAWMLQRIKAGEELFGRKTNPPPGGIYYIAADRKWEEYSEVIDKAGLKIDGYYSYSDDPGMNLRKFTKTEPATLLKYGFDRLDLPERSVVVVDIFGLFLGDDLRKYRDIMALMWEYSRWISEKNITMIGSVHATKQKASEKERYVRLFDRVMGGGPMRGACSTATYLTSAEEAGDQGFQLFEICPRLEPAVTFRMDWDEEGMLVPIDEAIRSDSKGNQEKVLELIPYEAGVAAKDLVRFAQDAHGISRATVFRALQQLKRQGLIAKDAEDQKLWRRLRLN